MLAKGSGIHDSLRVKFITRDCQSDDDTVNMQSEPRDADTYSGPNDVSYFVPDATQNEPTSNDNLPVITNTTTTVTDSPVLGRDRITDDRNGHNSPHLDRYSFWARPRHRLWIMLEYPYSGTWARIVAIVSLLFIVLCVLAFCVESLPENHRTSGGWFRLEVCCMVMFGLEFILRFFSTPGIATFVFDWMNWIDLISFAPFFVEIMLTSNNHDMAAFALLRTLRLVRAVRIFRLTNYFVALQAFGRAMWKSAGALLLLGMFMCITIIIFSAALYFTERGEWDPQTRTYHRQVDGNDERSPFQSIPASFWYTVVTLTTVGYGDAVPVTFAGKLVASVSMICGLMIIALPMTILGVNFASVYDEYKRTSGRVEENDSQSNVDTQRLVRENRSSSAGEDGYELRTLGRGAVSDDTKASHDMLQAKIDELMHLLQSMKRNDAS